MKKNIEKQETYRCLSRLLTRAMKAEFFYQAIFIEYAILEDRLTSVLKNASVPVVDKKGNSYKISKKIDMIRSRREFSSKFVRQRISLELLDSIVKWKKKRDVLIHNLANVPYDFDAIRIVAEEGFVLLKKFKNKSQSVINSFKKENNIQTQV